MPPARHHVLAMVALGGSVGGLARHAVNRALPTASGGWPWATLLVNVTGAAILGALVGRIALRPGAPWMLRPLLGTGFCGAFTTFSAFMVETDALARHERAPLALVYVVVATVLGLSAAHAGVVVSRRMARRS